MGVLEGEMGLYFSDGDAAEREVTIFFDDWGWRSNELVSGKNFFLFSEFDDFINSLDYIFTGVWRNNFWFWRFLFDFLQSTF